MNPTFELDCADLVPACAAVFRRTGRVHIPGALKAAGAAALHGALTGEAPWALVVNAGDTVYDLPAEGGATAAELARLAAERGRTGFQFLFESIRLSDHGEPYEGGNAVFRALTVFLNSPAFLDFARAVTGDAAIAFCDAQATRYRPGHFLTVHDDGNAGKNRRAAIVLNMTPEWIADWGGLLQFIDEDGHVAEGFTPAFNALNIFRVPQRHAVSYVTPLAAGDRLSVTGWLRSR